VGQFFYKSRPDYKIVKFSGLAYFRLQVHALAEVKSSYLQARQSIWSLILKTPKIAPSALIQHRNSDVEASHLYKLFTWRALFLTLPILAATVSRHVTYCTASQKLIRENI